jgi:hypothetical protein
MTFQNLFGPEKSAKWQTVKREAINVENTRSLELLFIIF